MGRSQGRKMDVYSCIQVYPRKKMGLRPFRCIQGSLYAYKTRPSFLDRRISAQTVKEKRNISNESDSLGSRLNKLESYQLPQHNVIYSTDKITNQLAIDHL